MGIMKREMERQIERNSYFVCMREFPGGREAIVDPEITRREVIARIASGEYSNISFIHHIRDGAVEDVTEELKDEAQRIALQAAE